MHVIDNSNNEIRGGGVKNDAAGNEKDFGFPGLNISWYKSDSDD